jgi:small subunit ribosomal protein S6
MNNYEGLFIVRPDIKEEDLKNVYKSISEAIAKHGGAVKKEEPWGKRLLAYPIKKFKEGYYQKVEFSAPSEAITKLDASCKLNADIIRTMITRR